MSAFDKKIFDISGIRDKVKSSRDDVVDLEQMYENNFSWQEISQITGNTSNPAYKPRTDYNTDLNFSGKVLCGGKYSGEKLKGATFSGSDLRETDFSKADLQGADFTGADLSGADLTEANLNGAVFSGATLRGTNFTGAKMNGVTLVNADIQDAILLDVEMDQIAIDELQALVEWLAIYYPHKLNLRRMNLTLLDFSKIDLRAVNLRGVDFTGVDFTGVNVFELDLSECIITPEQIAQALGRTPTPLELKRILAPKKPKKKRKGIDFTAFFDSRGTAGVWDLSKHPGITVADLVKYSSRIYRAIAGKPEPRDAEILEQFHTSRNLKNIKDENVVKEHNEEMRKIIENRKREMLEKKAEENKDSKNVDITDYAAYEQAQKREKEAKLRQAKEQYKQNSQTSKVIDKYIQNEIAMSRTRGQRGR